VALRSRNAATNPAASRPCRRRSPPMGYRRPARVFCGFRWLHEGTKCQIPATSIAA
jgi:hypothetical protein